MSETATTIIKLLSALTSPKAAVKYISVAVFIIVSWKYFSELAKSLGTPEENISIVVLLMGVGFGSIAGQIVTWIGEFFWDFINRKIEAAKLARQAIEEKAANDLKRVKENARLLQKYTESFPHLILEQKEKLREMTLRDMTLDFSNMSFKALFENKYVNVISQISNMTYLVRLNPVIIEVTKTTWEQEIKENVDDYFRTMTPEKKKILEIMELREEDDHSAIEFDIKSTVFPYYSCIRIEAENENGFWLCFGSHYLNEFEKRTKKEYQDESWIEKSRISISVDSGVKNA